MAQIPGTVVAAQITTGDTANNFSIGDTDEMQGGRHQVADVTARDAISTERRKIGMVCYVASVNIDYRLEGGITNSDWVPFTGSGGTTAQAGSEYALALFVAGTNFTNSQVSVEVAARIFGDGTTAQHGSEYAYDLWLSGTNYTNSQVAIEVVTRTSQIQIEAAARVFGDGTTLAQAKAYANSISGSLANGSEYAYDLWLSGTNYTNSQITVEALNRTVAVQAEATARVFGDGSTAQHGSEYAYDLWLSGTHYTDAAIATASFSSAGSQFVLDHFYAGTTYADVKDALVEQHGSQFSVILRDQGTNYTNSQFTVVVAAGSIYTDSQMAAERAARVFGDGTVSQHGSEYAYDLWLSGTNFALSQVAAEAAARTAADLVVAQQGSQYGFGLWVNGTNYTNVQTAAEAAARTAADLVVAARGSEYAFDLWLTGTNFTNVQIAAAVISAGSSSQAVFWQGTNYTNAAVAAEALARAAADLVVLQQGSQFATILHDQGTNYGNTQNLVIAQQGSQFAMILHDQGTNYGNSQNLVIGQQGSQFAMILHDQGTAYGNSQNLVIAQQGSQFSVILRDQGTNFTLSQVAAEAATRATAISTEFSARANGDQLLQAWNGTNAAAIANLTNILGIAFTGTFNLYMAQTPLSKPDTRITIVNGVMTGYVPSQFLYDDFDNYPLGTVSASNPINKGSAWLTTANGSISYDVFTGTVAQDQITAYNTGTILTMDQGYGFYNTGTFAKPYINYLGVDSFEDYATGTIWNPAINSGTEFISPAVLFAY